MTWFWRKSQRAVNAGGSWETYASRDLEHVCNELGANWSSRLVLLVLAGIGEVRDNSGDPSGRGGAAGVDHDEQLHETIVDIAGSGGLKDEDILVSDGLANGNAGLAVGVVEAHRVSDVNAESEAISAHHHLAAGSPEPMRCHLDIPTRNKSTELRVGASRDELDFVCHLIQHCGMEGGKKKRGGRFFGGKKSRWMLSLPQHVP